MIKEMPLVVFTGSLLDAFVKLSLIMIIIRFNNIYKTELLIEPKPKLTQIPLLKGLDGNKMGKSCNNDIKISDTEEVTTKKIMTAITDRSRLRKTDLGHPDECEVVYPYWKIFGTEDEISEIKSNCEKGLIGCADCKRRLACKCKSCS